MPITELPTPPSRQDPANFASRGDALMAALPTFVEEANELAAAMNLNSTTDTSASSVAISVGTKTFTVSADKSFQPGMYLIFADAAAPSTNSILGQVTSYVGTTLTVFVKSLSGSGTKSDWVISQSAPGGASLDTSGKVVETANNADLAAVANAATGTTQFSHRNKIINGDFRINQRAYASGTAVGTGLYGLDRWKMAASGDTFTYSTTANKTTVTIPSGKVLRQVIEGLNLQTGTYVLSWEGTAQGKIGAGSLAASGVTGAITGGVDTTIEFGPGTVANVQLEIGSVATPFEHRAYGVELALCMRYYEMNFDSSVGVVGQVSIFTGNFSVAGNLSAKPKFMVEKRSIPTTITTWDKNGNAGTVGTYSSGAVFTTRTPTISNQSTKQFTASFSTSDVSMEFHWSVSSEL